MSAEQIVGQRFGRIEIRPAQRQLLLDGSLAKLGARAFDLLLALVDRRDRVVSKSELLDLVWPGLVVEENNLQVQTSALRKLLGPQAIATIPGRDYRFCAPHADHAPADPIPPEALPEATPTTLTNLPAQLPALFGRERDLAALRSLLAAHRLVTVAGAGGIGKTRLAQAAARDAVAASPDGVWFVELAPVTDPRLLLGTVARALAAPLDAQAGTEELAARIAGRRMLVVLDNCEHLVDAVATLAHGLLRAAPQVRLLVTSQEPLKIADEHVVRLGTLAIPDEGSAAPLDSGGDEGALSMFEAAVRALQPRFALDAVNRAAAIEICRRLDGIPLAIELAAARVPLLGVHGLRQQLDDRFKLLTSGTRLAPPRQQTLRAALEWSHALLSAGEQQVFRRLGVFAGGFGLDSVQPVVADAGEGEWEVLERLAGLVEKSLVTIDFGATPRYRLLESGRAFALERLSLAGEADSRAQRHAEAMLERFEQAYEGQWTQRGDLLLPGLLADIDNLRAALVWASGQPGQSHLLVALAGASAWLWKPANLDQEGMQWCTAATVRIDAATVPALEARLLYGYASIAHQVEAEKELAALRRAAELWQGLADRRNRFLALTLTAQKLAWQYDLAGAEAATREADSLFDPRWPSLLREPLLVARTYLLEASGHPDQGQVLMEELVALMRGWGDPHKLASAQQQLAESLFVQGKAAEAVAVRREVAAGFGAARSISAGWNLMNLSAALTYQGEVEAALQAARESLPLLRLAGRLAGHFDHWALLACQRRRFSAAARALGRVDALFASSGFGRELSERRARDMAYARLQQALPGAELERLMAQGAAWPDDEALAAEMLS